MRESRADVAAAAYEPLGGNFAMGWLPEPDRPRLAAEHNGVVPTPHHHSGGARCLSDGYQMTW